MSGADKNAQAPASCWAYLMRCENGSLYGGWTSDLPARMYAHKTGRGGARYTKAFGGRRLAYAEQCPDKSSALRREASLKKLPKAEKERLCAEWAERHRPRLRFARPEDAAAVAEIYNWYVRYGTATFRYEPLAGQELDDWFAAALRTAPVILACDADGTPMAFALAHPWRGAWAAYQWDVETTVYAAADCRAFGAAGPAYDLLIDCLRAMGYWNAYAVLADPNPESERFHDKRGFLLEGCNPRCGYKHGHWLGITTWRLALRGGRSAPEPVKALTGEALDALLRKAEQKIVHKK